jgi:hypothetical protein
MNDEIEQIINTAPDYLKAVLKDMVGGWEMATMSDWITAANNSPISEPVRPPLMGEIVTLDYTPDNGYVYTAVATPIPYRGFEGGGNVNEYILLTLWSPPYGRVGITYVVHKSTPLVKRYISEKFDPDNKLNEEHLTHVTSLALLIQSKCSKSAGFGIYESVDIIIPTEEEPNE